MSDGESALAAALSAETSLVVSDLDMPGLNGIELTAALRGDPRTEHVPVVIATGVGGPTEWRVLAKLGADAFLVKPFEPGHLVALVSTLLSHASAWPRA